MKSLNKKISVVVLTGLVLTGSCLSQGFVAYADNSSLLNHKLLKNPNSIDTVELLDHYMTVEQKQKEHSYDAIYLGEHAEFKSKYDVKRSNSGKYQIATSKRIINKHYYLEVGINDYYFVEFDNKSDFLKRIKAELDKYRRLNNSIIIRVGKSFFKIFFSLTPHERDVLPVKYLAEEFGFNIAYADWNGFYGKIVMESHLYNRDDLKNDPQLRKQLEEEPKKENVFKNPEDLAYYLRYGFNYIPSVFTRYRIGNHDYILYKEY